ncbi:MAG: acyltransferase [Longimicrobiales bacterium]
MEGGGGIGVRLGYRRALDGFRGLAILMVVPFNWRWGVSGGYTGVDLFLVLSGFLITWLLVEEWWESGGIRIGAFYMRRFLRLLPALVFMLAVMSGLATVLLERESAVEYYRASVAVLFYVANWLLASGDPEWIDTLGPFNHAWSLSVEEQFYLVWAPLVAAVLALRGGLRWLAGLVGVGALASWGWRAWLSAQGAHPWRVYMGTDTRADALLMGALLAVGLLAYAVRGRTLPKAPAPLGWLAVALLVAGAFTLPDGAVPWFQKSGHTAVAVVAAAALWHLTTRPDDALSKAFASGPLVGAGRVSYGVYLWHLPVAVMLNEDRLGVSGLPLEGARLVALAGVVAFSWIVIERPALRMKRRWSGGRTPGASGEAVSVSPDDPHRGDG